MAVLLVEDEGPKRENVKAVLERLGLLDQVVEAYSVGSAIKQLRSSKFDLVVLDMSLPTFDIVPGESGGRPQGFGGVEVLRYMDRFKADIPTIVVTAYPAFSQGDREIDLTSLSESLARDHPNTFRHLVFYNSMFSTWKEELMNHVREAVSR
jgi:CheY-like chemotaxis protein